MFSKTLIGFQTTLEYFGEFPEPFIVLQMFTQYKISRQRCVNHQNSGSQVDHGRSRRRWTTMGSGTNERQWETMGNNGQQWATMVKNRQQWATMDNNGQQ